MNVSRLKLNGNKLNIHDVRDTGIIVCIGDSYLEGYTPDGTVKSWGEYLSELTGRSVKRYYRGGCGFGRTDSGTDQEPLPPRNFDSLTDDAISDTSYDHDLVGLVVYAGGYNDNDGSFADVIKERIMSCKTKIAQAFPTAHMVVYNVGYSYAALSNQRTFYGMDQTLRMWQQGCLFAGVEYHCDTLKAVVGQRSLFSTDGIHPLATGQRALAVAMLSDTKYCLNNTQLFYTDSQNVRQGTNFYYRWVDGVLHLNGTLGGQCTEYVGSSIQLDGTAVAGYIDVSEAGIVGHSDYWTRTIPCFVKVNNVYYNGYCKVGFVANSSKLKLMPVAVTGTGYVSGICDYIRVNDTLIIDPADC